MTPNTTGASRRPYDERLHSRAERLAGTLLEIKRLGARIADTDPVQRAAFTEVTELAVVECLALLRMVKS